MRTLFLISLNLFPLLIFSQVLDVENDYFDFNNQTIDFVHNGSAQICDANNLGHRSWAWPNLEFDKIKSYQVTDTWCRSLKFEFNFNDNCEYDHTNQNQLDWNKLMYVGSHLDEDHVKLGWRYNVGLELMDVGLYSHINHDNPNDYVGREFQFITSVALEEFHNCELIYGAEGLGVIVGDIGHFIKRDNFFAINSNVTSNIRRVGYFGGQECYPHSMDIDLQNIRGDNGFTNWHGGACEKTFSNSIFYALDDLEIEAARSITMSREVFRGQYALAGSGISGELPNPNPQGLTWGDEIPFLNQLGESSSHVTLLPGSEVICSAGESILLLRGFHALPGAVFIAEIDQGINCNTFLNESQNNKWTENTEIHTEPKTNLESFVDKPFPNPTKGIVSIGGIQEFTTLKILDITGKVVMENIPVNDNQVTFDISHLSNGIYILKSISASNSLSYQIIKY